MKKLIIMCMFFFLVPLVFAIYGGEQNITHYDKCFNLSINVSGLEPIDSGEYSFVNCNQTSNNYWFCKCYDNYDLVMQTQPNTLNNYSILVLHTWTEISNSGGGGIRSHTYSINNNISNVSVIVKNETKMYSLPETNPNSCKALCGNNVCDINSKCNESIYNCPEDCLDTEALIKQEEILTKNNSQPPPVLDLVNNIDNEVKSKTGSLIVIGFIIGIIIMIIIGLIYMWWRGKKREEFEKIKEEIKYEDVQNLVNNEK